MALGDLMASRFSQSSVAVVSNHLEECGSSRGGDDGSSGGGGDSGGDLSSSQRRDSEVASSSGYGNAAASTSTATSMAYLPQTVVLCEFRHEAFEACLPAGPSDSGLVSKWRPKDRVTIPSLSLIHFNNAHFFVVVAIVVCCIDLNLGI